LVSSAFLGLPTVTPETRDEFWSQFLARLRFGGDICDLALKQLDSSLFLVDLTLQFFY